MAHDPERTTPFGHVYWYLDGRAGMLMRFDFQQPHGPGSLDHSRAAVRRYPELRVARVAGVVSHMVLDQGPAPAAAGQGQGEGGGGGGAAQPLAPRVLFVVDTGGGRVLRIDPDSGRLLRSAKREWPIYSSLAESFEYSIYGCTRHTVFAAGLSLPSGIAVDVRHVYVAEATVGRGRVLAYDRHSGALLQVGQCLTPNQGKDPRILDFRREVR